MPPEPLELRLPSAASRRKLRLRADSNTWFGVRIFILSDSNFFQSQKHCYSYSPVDCWYTLDYSFNPYSAMGDYSRPKLTKRSLLWATIVKLVKKKRKKKIEKKIFEFFFYFRFVVPFYLRFKYS